MRFKRSRYYGGYGDVRFDEMSVKEILEEKKRARAAFNIGRNAEAELDKTKRIVDKYLTTITNTISNDAIYNYAKDASKKLGEAKGALMHMLEIVHRYYNL